MATKTISIDLDAYDRLRRARLRPDESFSQVIKRGHWARPLATGAALLAALEAAPLPSRRVLDRLEKGQSDDRPPDNAWND